MPIDLPPGLEAEIRQRADAEGVSAGQFIDRLLHSGVGSLNGVAREAAIHSVAPANDASIALLMARIAAAPSDPESVRAAEEDLQEFMDNVNAERKRAGSRRVYPETA